MGWGSEKSKEQAPKVAPAPVEIPQFIKVHTVTFNSGPDRVFQDQQWSLNLGLPNGAIMLFSRTTADASIKYNERFWRSVETSWIANPDLPS